MKLFSVDKEELRFTHKYAERETNSYLMKKIRAKLSRSIGTELDSINDYDFDQKLPSSYAEVVLDTLFDSITTKFSYFFNRLRPSVQHQVIKMMSIRRYPRNLKDQKVNQNTHSKYFFTKIHFSNIIVILLKR